jgi:hypothetical protein
MPHLTHKRVPGISHHPSSVACHLTSPHNEPPLSEQHINYNGWPDFPPKQSLSDDTAQLHLTLQSPPSSHSASPSPSPSPTPSPGSLSRQPSSGGGTPESGGSATTSVTASPDLSLAPQEQSSLAEKQHSKKKNRLSAGTLASLLPVNQDGERRRARRERKRTEKLVRHEQTLQELRTADRRRAYFRDASHRQELVFGPEVRYVSPTAFPYRPRRRTWQDVFTTDFCYGFIQFAPTLSLNLPGGISFDLMHYWDGQPVRFMCCERKREAESGGEEGGADDVPWGRVLWCVAIEPVEDDDEEGSQPVPQCQPRSQTVGENGGPQDNLVDEID